MSTLDDALTWARQFVPGVDQVVSVVSQANTVRNALQHLQQAEETFTAVRNRAESLRRADILTEEDYRNYDVLRQNLFDAQLRLFLAVQPAVARISVTVASQIPAPIMAPDLPPPYSRLLPVNPAPLATLPTDVREAGAEAAPSAGVEGLGQAPAAAAPAGAVFASPWGWAAAALAIIVVSVAAAVLAYYLYRGAREWGAIYVTYTQGRMLDQLWSRREATMAECVSSGRSRESCLAEVEVVVPTPRAAGLEPRLLQDTDTSSIILWTLLGVAGAAALGLFIWVRYFRKPKGTSGLGKPALNKVGPIHVLKRRPKRLKSLDDGPSSRYYLEIEED